MNMEELNNMDVNFVVGYVGKIYQNILDYIPTVILAVVIFFVGRYIIKYVDKAVSIFFQKADFDEALERFMQSLISISLKIILTVIIVVTLGVETSSFIAAFGAMVFAVGMALQGSLSNFAGGVLILFFRPFKIGDFITSGSHSGTVTDIQIFNTILKTTDGKKVILPNGPVSNDTIVNFSDTEKRRAEFVIGISYNDDIKKAKEVLNSLMEKNKNILKEEGLTCAVHNLGDNAVEILVRF